MPRHRLLPLILLCTITSCSPVPHHTVSSFGGREEGARLDRAPMPERIAALTREIRALSPSVSPDEAAPCAEHAIRYADLLRRSYNLTTPVEVNNFLINTGVKKRGRCFELTDDLYAEMLDQRYRTLTFARAIAHADDYFYEHNCVVVNAPGNPFGQGIVLDAWRNAGVLRWSRVSLDDYPWRPLNLPGETPAPEAAKPPAANTVRTQARR